MSHSCVPTLLQDLIAQGLLEPPKPKVKISNMMRVLGENAVMDPTAIESEVRQQMQERQQVSQGSAARRCRCHSSWCAWQPSRLAADAGAMTLHNGRQSRRQANMCCFK